MDMVQLPLPHNQHAALMAPVEMREQRSGRIAFLE
jgi:hypothetical protein